MSQSTPEVLRSGRWKGVGRFNSTKATETNLQTNTPLTETVLTRQSIKQNNWTSPANGKKGSHANWKDWNPLTSNSCPFREAFRISDQPMREAEQVTANYPQRSYFTAYLREPPEGNTWTRACTLCYCSHFESVKNCKRICHYFYIIKRIEVFLFILTQVTMKERLCSP